MDIDGVVERKNEMEFQPLPHPQRSTLWVLRQNNKNQKIRTVETKLKTKHQSQRNCTPMHTLNIHQLKQTFISSKMQHNKTHDVNQPMYCKMANIIGQQSYHLGQPLGQS